MCWIFSMNKYPVMVYYPLPLTPPGVNIRQDYSVTHQYTIPQSQTDCWPMRLLPDWQQVVISANQSTFWSQQQGTMLAWLSINPNGINVIPPGLAGIRVNLNGLGNTWCFYNDQLALDQVKPAQASMPINVNQLGDGNIPAYWFNVSNIDNKQNAYFLQFEYYNQYTSFIQ